ncbi:unnamed protein product [Coffea canephora]|uniref:GATA-type domain-containing protein n=1 Tax=Coffea canephora TaxID=49390 RepID=A0A068V7D8_COFCA|nr:unnamed protein product [Coffea canephora]
MVKYLKTCWMTKGNRLKQGGEENASNKVFSISGSNGVGSSREIQKKCIACGSDDTPLWRKGPHGPRTLCNACGLRYARLMKRLA